MRTRAKIAEHVRAFRQRQVAAGNREVTLTLPREAVDFSMSSRSAIGLREPQPGVFATD